MLLLRDRAVAFVGATRWYLVPPLDELPDDDRERRAVIALCRALVNDAAVVRFDPPHPPPD